MLEEIFQSASHSSLACCNPVACYKVYSSLFETSEGAGVQECVLRQHMPSPHQIQPLFTWLQAHSELSVHLLSSAGTLVLIVFFGRHHLARKKKKYKIG